MSTQNIIQLLPDSIANQIAAGEVVQRPASALKELLENAIDAGATSIDVVVKEAGKTLIQVIDNGNGMSVADARLCFERHATSKIRTSDDLFKIRTMGFRGEALASIAAISQVELRTARAEDEVGTLVKIEGSVFKSQQPISTPVGTNIQVKNLFFNVPARRNFLKTNAVEMKHILEEFQRIALAHPETGFTLRHNDADIYQLAPGKLVRRITDIFGKNYREMMAFCQEDTSLLSVRGYVGKPESAKKTRGEQFFFVNNRFIKSSYLHHAITSAFDGSIPESHHPFYVLFIDIEPSHIDINIHPTKTEIKFDDEKSIYAILMATVRKAIGVYNLSSTIDFDSDVNFLNPFNLQKQVPVSFEASPTPNWAGKSKSGDGFPEKNSVSDWVKLFEGLNEPEESKNDSFELPLSTSAPVEAASFTISSRINRMTPEHIIAPDTAATYHQLFNRFIICQTADGVVLVDQKAAYERILFERYKKSLLKKSSASQQLLFPKTIRLSAIDVDLVLETKEEIGSLGFELDQLGPNELIIRGVPADMPEEGEQEMFEELLDQIRLNYTDIKLQKPDSLARTLARRFASKYVMRLGNDEIRQFTTMLFESSDPNWTPSGEPIIIRLSPDKLMKLFKYSD